MRLDQFSKRFLEAYKNKNTADSYKVAISQIIAYFPEASDISDITQSDVNSYIAHLAASSISETTKRRQAIVLQLFFRAAEKEGLCAKPPQIDTSGYPAPEVESVTFSVHRRVLNRAKELCQTGSRMQRNGAAAIVLAGEYGFSLKDITLFKDHEGSLSSPIN